MKLKIGDRVIAKEDIAKRIKKGMTGTVIDTDDDYFIGVEFDKYIDGHSCCGKGKEGHCFYCKPDTIEKIVKETKLEDITLQKGDIVTLKDGKIIAILEDNIDVKGTITKIERPTKYETIYEASKDILNKKEKEYLSAVIKPFRSKVKFIEKVNIVEGKEFIKIKIYTYKFYESIVLPYFKEGTMYKGMETYKKYTLEELGL